MPPKGAPKMTSTSPSSDTVEQATAFTCTFNVQAPEGDLVALGGLALPPASCQSQELLALIHVAPPLGLHYPNMDLTVNR